MARVVIAEDSPTQQAYIRALVERQGHEVEAAADGQEALELIARRPPDVVITDMIMPRMNGLGLVEAVRRDFPHVPVILVTAHGSEELAAEALCRGAASYVPKRRQDEDLPRTLEKVLAVSRRDRESAALLKWLRRAEAEFELDNDPALVAPLVGHLEELLERWRLCGACEVTRVGIALQEAILNAMDHGNLELSSDLRQVDESVYTKARHARRQQAPYRDRRVVVFARVGPDDAVFRVRDQGPGFNPRGLPDPTDPANLERVGGRGLLLIRTFMDSVGHNATGNEITMLKRRGR